MKDLSAIKRPTLLINEAVCRSNIARMVEKSVEKNLLLRPHFKTHNSIDVGRWFREAGIGAITVSSVSMATLFAGDEWMDITIAFPLNVKEIDDINQLSGQVKLNLLVENEMSIAKLAEDLKFPAGFFIKTDTGYHRTGIAPGNFRLIDSILEIAHKNLLLYFRGFMTHSGHSYKARGKKDILEIHHHAVDLMQALKLKYSEKYPDLIISIGDTPSCSVAEDFTGIDEIRPGNFIYYDLMQEQIGSCRYRDIGVAVACPVVAMHDDRQEIVIYGGAIHLSKEQMTDNTGKVIYGKVVEPAGPGWSDPVKNVWVSSLSQEHGIVSSPNEEFYRKINVGDVLLILPVHSCLAANLLKDQVII